MSRSAGEAQVAGLARRAAPVAVVAALLAVAALIAVATVTWSLTGTINDRANALWGLSWAGLPIVGAVIVSRRPQHVIGWLLVGTGVCVAAGLAALTYADLALLQGRGLPRPLVALAIAQCLVTLGMGLVPFVILFFPTGRIDSPPWRRIAVAGGVCVALMWTSGTFRGFLPYSFDDGLSEEQLPNPLAIPSLADVFGTLMPIASILSIAFLLSVIGHAVWRTIRSTGVERAQRTWFAVALGAFPLLMLAAFVLSPVDRMLSDVAAVAATVVGLNGIAVAIGIAILRYRLFEIDRIVRRTATYALVSVVLVLLYGGVVLALGSFSRAIAGGASSDLVVAASTLAVAAAFGPVRRRIRASVDRRFDRASYDARRTVETFGQRLRDDIDLEAFRGDLVSVVDATLRPSSVSVWIPATASRPSGDRRPVIGGVRS